MAKKIDRQGVMLQGCGRCEHCDQQGGLAAMVRWCRLKCCYVHATATERCPRWLDLFRVVSLWGESRYSELMKARLLTRSGAWGVEDHRRGFGSHRNPGRDIVRRLMGGLSRVG